MIANFGSTLMLVYLIILESATVKFFSNWKALLHLKLFSSYCTVFKFNNLTSLGKITQIIWASNTFQISQNNLCAWSPFHRHHQTASVILCFRKWKTIEYLHEGLAFMIIREKQFQWLKSVVCGFAWTGLGFLLWFFVCFGHGVGWFVSWGFLG